jgi:hypothetical protein
MSKNAQNTLLKLIPFFIIGLQKRIWCALPNFDLPLIDSFIYFCVSWYLIGFGGAKYFGVVTY